MALAVSDTLDIEGLTSAIAALDVPSFDNDELARAVIRAEVLLNAVHAYSAVVLEEFERRGAWSADGSLSGAGWAATRTGTSPRVLRARRRAGAGLRLLPSASPAARAGRLSPAHLAALAGCVRRHPDLAARDEVLLVDQAQALDADAFGLVVRRWDDSAADVDAPDPATLPTQEPVDELHLSQTLDGRYRLDGSFSADTGQLVFAALDAEVDRQLRAARDGDPSAPMVASQVRAAALVDLVSQTMRREPSDASVPDRYRVAVVVAHDAEELPMACCDSPAFRVVLGAHSEVLDIGRQTQQWPTAIRRAITIRDGGCVFPGCDRPPSWCDVHHCLPWQQGGTTGVSNGALLCRRHHSFIHGKGWTITVENGEPIARRPDGSQYVIAPLGYR